MRTRMEFVDGATDYFDKFTKVNLGLVKQGLNAGSSQLAKTYRQEIKKQEPSDWSSVRATKGKYKGKRRLSVMKEDRKKVFGQKHSKKTGKPMTSNANISDHVNFYTPKNLDSLYAVIGGGHPTFYPIKYVDGIPKGHLKRVTATSKATLEILDRLNDGATIVLKRKQRGLIARGRGVKAKKPIVIRIKSRKFAESARQKGAGKALQKIKNIYERNFQKAVANINAKEERVAV